MGGAISCTSKRWLEGTGCSTLRCAFGLLRSAHQPNTRCTASDAKAAILRVRILSVTWPVHQQITGLAIQIRADLFNGVKTHTLDLALLEQ